MLDRERHDEIVRECREAGARVKLIPDGDVAGAIATAWRDAGTDILFGIGGTPEGVIAACALKALGGSILGRLAPRNDEERRAALDLGYDFERILTTDDLVSSDDVFFAATGISDGDLVRGVRYSADGARTQTVVMRSKTGTIRTIDANHRLAQAEALLPPRVLNRSSGVKNGRLGAPFLTPKRSGAQPRGEARDTEGGELLLEARVRLGVAGRERGSLGLGHCDGQRATIQPEVGAAQAPLEPVVTTQERFEAVVHVERDPLEPAAAEPGGAVLRAQARVGEPRRIDAEERRGACDGGGRARREIVEEEHQDVGAELRGPIGEIVGVHTTTGAEVDLVLGIVEVVDGAARRRGRGTRPASSSPGSGAAPAGT